MAKLLFRCCLVLVLACGSAIGQTRPEADMCAVPPGAQPQLPAKLMTGMGTTNMPVTTSSEEARKFFNQGVSQMHSFWFLESERSFLQAATLDPNMAMAYWGISVSAAGDYRPAFQLMRDPTEGGRAGGPEATRSEPAAIARSTNGAALNPQIRAREAAEKAMSLGDKVTARERMYIEAEWARRDPATPAASHDRDHITGLRKLIAAYPDDEEAKSILGLALLDGYDSVTKKPRTNTLEGIALLESIVAKNDNHFGAHHYLIHGYEGSETPERAWHACRRYPELVPNIPHALHMPGHIYAQSDRVDDAIRSFTAAAENELGYLKADVLYPNGHHGHNVHFMIQALNLDGRYQDSMKWARHLMNEFKETPRERTSTNQRVTWRQGYFGLIKTLVRFERWDVILDGSTIPTYDRPEQNAWHLWATGLAYANTDRADKARTTLQEMSEQVKKAEGVKRPLSIAEMELEATVAAHSGDSKKAYELFRKAADAEAALIYTEPPSYPRPVVEGFANTALALGDATVAEQAYREALQREPGSGRAFFGLGAALKAQGKVIEGRLAEERARQQWDKADADLPQFKSPVRATYDRQ
jgi:tetratricopeptide (TPR) repeat protein